MKNETKIISTIGPASEDMVVLSRLIKEGVDIFRFNLKHNTISWHNKIIDRVREAAKQQGKTIEILIDLPNFSFQKGIILAAKNNVDYIALSYIKQAQEVIKFKQLADNVKLSANIIVKIETREALNYFSAILNEADTIMVARGDLGRAIPIEKIPFVQKELIMACRKAGKNVIVATEMLLSMVSAKEPTRAEVSDVANAVLEGSNAVMLSEETTIGKYPVEAVRIMKKTIDEADSWQKLGHLEILIAKDKKFKFGL